MMINENALLMCENSVVGYYDRPVLNGVSARFQTGEFVALIGPNGAGKSTFLKSLLGHLHPTSGTIVLDGKPLTAWDAKARAARMAYIPQDFTLQFDYRVRDFVLMGRTPYLPWWASYSAQDYRICDQVLQQLDLTSFAHRMISELSGGERQRVSIARALTQQTDIILMDEAFANLDINHQIELMQLLSQINSQHNKLIILISHNLNLAAAYCRRILMLSEGRIIASGSPDEVLTPINLQTLYHTDLQVVAHPTGGHPMILYPGASDA